ncbi:MAG: ATP-dependent DNA helicase RecG [Phycisphaerae bacterium]|nr:ATP-dependent DNA helicase RecG [Phycisphaerae bacterium]
MTQSQTGYRIEPDTPVQFLKGVGPSKAQIFAGLGVQTVADLLEYYPRDYVFAPKPTPIADLMPEQDVTILGVIESTDFYIHRRPPIFEATVTDGTGRCRIVWFHGAFLQKQLKAGQIILATGKVTLYKHNLQLTNPKFAVVDPEKDIDEHHFSGGVYPAAANLSSPNIKNIIRPVLEHTERFVVELYTDSFLKKNQLIDRAGAFHWIHDPPDEEKIAKAKRRLKFDEFFLMQLGLAIRRYRSRHFTIAPKLPVTKKIDSRIRKRFPFLLTEDQDKAIADIVNDLADTTPMNRLLQGDVGSGKTVVALYAALAAVANKKQVAIMAPTEILAAQHFQSIERYLRDSDVTCLMLTGGITGAKRKELLSTIKSGDINIVVGTVAILQNDVEFKKLGLVVIDEQHKFGVEQRSKLRKQHVPHCLVMTATPIPRTLAMTAFGDLDVSIIKHSPPGRGQTITRWVERANQRKAEEFIAQRLRAGRQAYFVYPRITGDDSSDIKAATDEWQNLKTNIFPQFKVELLHGQMPSEKKQRVMDDFRKGKIDVLVSTVVIEVGVDVPNATVMVIEGADRFGLAQLHQLRGRIGRGQAKSYCFLFAETENEIAKSRLDMMTRSNDGFEIAEHDLRLRGPGELFSTRQHGLPDLKIANIIDDYELLMLARREAFELISQDPMLTKPANLNIRKALTEKFGESLGLADIA